MPAQPDRSAPLTKYFKRINDGLVIYDGWLRREVITESVLGYLAHGGDPNAPLFCSAYRGVHLLPALIQDRVHVDTILAVVAAGADVNAVGNKIGRPPLAIAVEQCGKGGAEGTNRLIAALVARGADVDALDDHGETPLSLACEEVFESTWGGAFVMDNAVRPLLAAKPDLRNGWRLLWHLVHRATSPTWRASHAREASAAPLLKMLLDAGADPNREAPLLLAAEGDAVSPAHELADLLLSAGPKKANVGVRDGEGRTALHIASRTGNLAVVEVLIKHGADVRAVDKEGHQPLHLARKAAVVRALAAAGADVSAQGPQGITPLLCVVAQSGEPEAFRALLDLGARVDVPDGAGRTPFEWLCWYKLYDSSHPRSPPCKVAIAKILIMVRAGQNVDDKKRMMSSPLEVMCDGSFPHQTLSALWPSLTDAQRDAVAARRSVAADAFEAGERGTEWFALALVDAGADVPLVPFGSKSPARGMRGLDVETLIAGLLGVPARRAKLEKALHAVMRSPDDAPSIACLSVLLRSGAFGASEIVCQPECPRPDPLAAPTKYDIVRAAGRARALTIHFLSLWTGSVEGQAAPDTDANASSEAAQACDGNEEEPESASAGLEKAFSRRIEEMGRARGRFLDRHVIDDIMRLAF
jgi:ankyrin repeat protein